MAMRDYRTRGRMFNSSNERAGRNGGISMGPVRGVAYGIMNRSGQNALEGRYRAKAFTARRSGGSTG